MNEVARAVEREFDSDGRTVAPDGVTDYVVTYVSDDYRTLQRLLKEAAWLVRNAGASYQTVFEKVGSRWEERKDAFLAELPEGYGNG